MAAKIKRKILLSWCLSVKWALQCYSQSRRPGVLPVGMTSETVSAGITGTVNSTVIISTYSAIHKAAIQPAAVQNDLRRSFLPAAPIDSQWTLFCSTGIIPGKPVERPWTVKASALWIALLANARAIPFFDVCRPSIWTGHWIYEQSDVKDQKKLLASRSRSLSVNAPLLWARANSSCIKLYIKSYIVYVTVFILITGCTCTGWVRIICSSYFIVTSYRGLVYFLK